MLVRMALAKTGNRHVPLDTLLVSLRGQPETPPAVEVRNDPPVIFASARPASLVVFDGEPVLAPVSGTRLSFAVNTNWDVFFDAGNSTWYLLGEGFWLAAPDAKGPWTPTGALPAAFSALPDDANFSDVRKQVPGRPIAAKDAPTIFVSTAPAEIIVTIGPPSYQAIPGTSLQYIANSDAAVFRNTTGGRFYYLVSGRWFSGPTLAGAVKTAGGDVYAGADGNVYKKTSDGWQKYDNGSWNSVRNPAQQNAAGARASAQTSAEAGSASRAAPTASGAAIAPNERAAGASACVQRTAAASGGGRKGFDGMGQLKGDRQARTMGAERHQQFQGGSRGFAGRGGGGHARR